MMNMWLEFSAAAFLASFILIVVAEMGDKTQFIAMSFACKNNPYKVLLGILIAVLANFSIMVVVGELITTVVPIDVISLAASLSFIAFGLWTLKPEKTKEEDPKPSRFGVVGAVAAAFFIAEFGDKTQLATISLAANYQSALAVLAGATAGMLVADGIGILAGVVLGKHIPEKILKWTSAAVFVIFGLVGVYEVLPKQIGLAETMLTLTFLIVFCIVTAILITRKSNRTIDMHKQTPLENMPVTTS